MSDTENANEAPPPQEKETGFPSMHSRRRSAEMAEHMGELNLVPYLDIMVNLIMFLLVSITSSITLGMINVSAPASAEAGMSDEPQEQKEVPLNLTIAVNDRGFYIGGSGGVLGAEEKKGVDTAGNPTIPRLPNGEYDFKRLTEKVAEIKEVYPKETRAIVAADGHIQYEILVKVMDAIREKGDKLLFYDVLLSAV